MSGDVDPSTRPLLERHLWTGDELVWGERPGSVAAVAARGARRGYLAALPVVGPVMAVSLLLYYELAKRSGVTLTPLVTYGLPMVILAMGVAVGAAWGWWRTRRSAPDVVYGLTTRRVLIAPT